MDWRTQTLPDAFTLTGTAIGFALTCVQALFLAPGEGDVHLKHSLRMSSPGSMAATGDVFLTGPEALVLGRIGAIVAAAGLVLLIRWLYKKLRGKEGLGLGDAKLMAMMAAFLGFWPAMLAGFVGVILCATYAVVLLARGRATGQTRLPLGSFLSIGGLVAALFGERLIDLMPFLCSNQITGQILSNLSLAERKHTVPVKECVQVPEFLPSGLTHGAVRAGRLLFARPAWRWTPRPGLRRRVRRAGTAGVPEHEDCCAPEAVRLY